LLKSDDIYDTGKLQQLIENNVGSFKGTVIFLNAIGGAHVEKKSNLTKLNKDSALCFAKAVDNFLEKRKYINQSILIQLSSIAAALLKDEYGSVKRETDACLLDNYDNIDQILCFRVGYVVQSLLKGSIVKDVHDFSPEQLAKYFPLQPIIIYGLHENKIYPVHMQDLVFAILNTANIYEKNNKVREIVNATGSEGYTQKELFSFYTEKIFKKTFRPFEIPIEAFDEIAKHFPHGHIAPYAGEYIRLQNTKLDETLFERLLGRKTTSIQAIKDELADPTDAIVSSPIRPFLTAILKKLSNKEISLKTIKETVAKVIRLTIQNKYRSKNPISKDE